LNKVLKILFLEKDPLSFNAKECIAKSLKSLPPLNLHHAEDAASALLKLEELVFDVVVIDEELEREHKFFMDNLNLEHPPILSCTDNQEFDREKFEKEFKNNKAILNIPKDDSLDGIVNTLILASGIALKHKH